MESCVKGIQLDGHDNVATVIRAVHSGDHVYWEDSRGKASIVAMTDVPRFHKIAVTDIPRGSPVIKYGHRIGVATTEIKSGCHVHIQNCRGTEVEELKT